MPADAKNQYMIFQTLRTTLPSQRGSKQIVQNHSSHNTAQEIRWLASALCQKECSRYPNTAVSELPDNSLAACQFFTRLPGSGLVLAVARSSVEFKVIPI